MQDPSFPLAAAIYMARLENATECPAILEPWGKICQLTLQISVL
jgi:hypothetical protein